MPQEHDAGFPDKNLWVDSSDVPIAVSLALRGAAGNYNWCQKAAGDSEAIAQGAQACRDDLVGARGIRSDPPYPLPLSLSNIIQSSRCQRRKIVIIIPTTNSSL